MNMPASVTGVQESGHRSAPFARETIRARLMGHLHKKIIGVQTTYGPSQVDLAKAKEWVENT